jgi:GYF domain 2
MKQYFIFVDNKQSGPLSFEELAARKIYKDTKVWFEGLDQWVNASEIEELKKIVVSVPLPPLPIHTINSKKVLPPKIAENQQVKPTVETAKILGFNKYTFYGILCSGIVLIAVMIYFDVVQNNERDALLLKNKQTELQNRQMEQASAAMEAEKIRLAEEERMKTDSIEKAKKDAVEKKLNQMADSLVVYEENLENAERDLASISDFKLLRSASKKEEQITTTQEMVDTYKNKIKKLKAESKRLNPNYEE